MRHHGREHEVAHLAVNVSPLDRARDLGAREDGLAVVVTSRADGSAQVSVVNAGVLEHPVTGESVVGFVARGATRKLVNLRLRARATVVFRSGWDWVAVEGDADLVGPDDLLAGLRSRRPAEVAPRRLCRRRWRHARRLGRVGWGDGSRTPYGGSHSTRSCLFKSDGEH